MKAFKGSLANYRLPLLVPALVDAGPVSGRLRLSRGPMVRDFLIEGGLLVSQASNDPREHLGQVLVDQRVLTLWTAVEAFGEARKQGIPFGAYVELTGLLPSSLLRQVMAQKAREGLFDCYGWESGQIEWEPDFSGPKAGVALNLRLVPLHLDAVALWKEWRTFRELFPDFEATVVVLPSARAGDPEELALLEKARAGASINELVGSRSRTSAIAGARLLTRLCERGMLAPAERPSPLQRGSRLSQRVSATRELLVRGDFEQAAASAAETLELGPVPEAEALYREAERQFSIEVHAKMCALDDQLEIAPLEGLPPEPLTASDLFLHTRLRDDPGMLATLKAFSLAELPTYHSVRRLIAAGLIRLKAASGVMTLPQ